MSHDAIIYLVRHGETAWNADGRYQGQLDSALTDRGKLQAEACGRLLAKFEVTALVASPLGRAQQTAAIISSIGTFPQVRWDRRLAEVSTGSWDGLTHIDIDAMWPGRLDGATAFDWYFRSPDGESFEEASARARAWLDELDGAVIAVTHGLISRVIRGAYLGLSVEEALELPVPQDVVWRLAEGQCVALTA